MANGALIDPDPDSGDADPDPADARPARIDLGEAGTAEQIHLWRPAGLAGVEVLHARASTRSVRVFNEAYTFGVMLRGLCDWRYRGRDYVHRAGQTLLNEPGEPYLARRHHVPGRWQVLFIDPAVFLREAAELGGAAPHFGAAQTDDPRLFAALRALHGSLLGDATALERESRLAACVRAVLAHAERAPDEGAARDRPAVRRVREYLHAHVADDVSLDDVARAAFCSKYHLLRVFRDEVGVSPHTYHMQLRLARALRLLRAGSAPSRAALEAGFAHQAHLGVHLKRALGVTPAAYARNRNPVIDPLAAVG